MDEHFQIARNMESQTELTPAAGDAWLERQAKILELVIDLAESLPFKGRGELQYPPLIRLRAKEASQNSSAL